MLGNSPNSRTLIRLEARKTFVLGVRINDPKGRPVDLRDCRLTMVAKPHPVDTETDEDNLFGDDAEALIEEPRDGYAVFTFQAATLDQPAGQYPYVIVLHTLEGHSSVLVKGTVVIEQNPEVSSVDVDYTLNDPAQILDVLLAERNQISVRIGHSLPPGMNYLRDDVLEVVEGFDPDSIALMPRGGTPGQVLTKTASGDYAAAWRPVGAIGPQNQVVLDPTGQPAGAVPVAQGDGTWDWDEVGIDASEAPEGTAPVADGEGGWHWDVVQQEFPQPDWQADPGQDGEILNKPELGTAAAANTEDFLAADTLVTELQGIHISSTIPTSGEEGHLYFVYED